MLKKMLLPLVLTISTQAFAVQKMQIINLGAVELFDALNVWGRSDENARYTESMDHKGSLSVRKYFQTSSEDFSIECEKSKSQKICELLFQDGISEEKFVERMRIEGESAQEFYDALRIVPFIPLTEPMGINPLLSRKSFESEDKQISIVCDLHLYSKKCEILKYAKADHGS